MPNQSELEFQLENWNRFNWLSGGPICEQQIHNLDVINWVLGDHPIEAQGQGGWYSRANASIGDAFDHHFLEFTYRSGVKLMAQSRQWDGCWSAIGEFVHGTQGSADLANGKIFDRDGRMIEHFPKIDDGLQQTQQHFFRALRRGVYVNNLDRAAVSTMTAIMGRIAIQTGVKVSWESCMRCNEQLAVIDQLATLQDLAPAIRNPNGMYQVKTPGDGKSQHV